MFRWADDLRRDLGYGLRMSWRSPGEVITMREQVERTTASQRIALTALGADASDVGRFVLAALAACLPARRAAQTDPIQALRA